MWEAILKKFTFFIAMIAFSVISVSTWSAVTEVTGTRTPRLVGGERYIELKGFMHGTIPSRVDPITNQLATYKTPVRILYPEKASKSNRTAVINFTCYTMQEISAVDTNFQHISTASCGGKLYPEKFIGSRGYTYVDLDWNRDVLEMTGAHGYTPGDIKEQEDVIQMIADAASLVKTPPPGLTDLPAAQISIYTGFSAGNMLLREYFLKYYGLTNQDGTPKYPRAKETDGVLQVGMGSFCVDLTVNAFQSGPVPCGAMMGQPDLGDVPGPGKVIVLNSESDVQVTGGGFMHMDRPNLRYYEVPGPHLTLQLTDLEKEDLFAELPQKPDFRQNLANTFKPIGAMAENLRRWIKEGLLPPPSVSLEALPNLQYTGIPCSSLLGELGGAPLCDHMGNSPDFFPFPVDIVGGLQPVAEIVRDEHGNALGGLRLPHAVAPLGEYNGLDLGEFDPSRGEFGAYVLPSDLQPQWQRIIAWELGGYFERFDNATINARYTSNKNYVNLVAAAALSALKNRWILPEDYVDYITAAKNSRIGSLSSYTDQDLAIAHGVFF